MTDEHRKLGTTPDLYYHVSCPTHGELGITDDENEALKLATDHIHRRHNSLVKAGAGDVDVHIREVTHVKLDHALSVGPPEEA
jgi:hypothetical protein